MAHGVTTATMQYRLKRSEHHAQELTMITPVFLVKAETGWNDGATVRSMVAELRSVTGKNALRWAIPANLSDASKPKRSARSRRSHWCS